MQKNVRRRAIYGVAIGILMHVDERIWRAPGDVGNATSFDFPVLYEIIPPREANDTRPLTIDEQAAPYIKAAKRLEYLGARALVGGCGFRALLQRKIADAINIPVFTSSLMLVPLAHCSLAKGKKGNQ